MTFDELRFIFNRSMSKTFNIKKLSVVSLVLALCGLLVVFFRGLAINASEWMIMSLTFLPFFLSTGVLMSMGIFLTRVYHDEIKDKEVKYSDILNKSWDVIIGASYFSIPLVMGYLVLWILLGIFVMLGAIPFVGNIFNVTLAFAPFLLNVGSLVLCILSISMLFMITPIIALKGSNRILVTQTIIHRIKNDLFSNVILAIIAIFPLLIFVGIMVLAAFMTGKVCYVCANPLQHVLQWFFIMIPFTILLSPVVVFYFNFAAESHVLLKE